jgi:hypothetical protein
MATKKTVLVDDYNGDRREHKNSSFFIGDHGYLCITQTSTDWGAKPELAAVYRVWSNVMYEDY